MGDDMSMITTAITAIIAGIVVYRLYSTFGRRTGTEQKRPNPFERSPEPVAEPLATLPRPAGPDDGPLPLADALAQIRAVDRGFEENSFLSGAKIAFGMIVDAFAKGDKANLRNLLAPAVYDGFNTAITERDAQGEAQEIRIDAFDDVDIVEARLEGRTARIGVRFQTRQVKVLRDRAGTVIDGDPEKAIEVVDIWTFARDTTSRDPNWLLVATRTA